MFQFIQSGVTVDQQKKSFTKETTNTFALLAGIGRLIGSSMLDQRTPAPPLLVPLSVCPYFVYLAKEKRFLRLIALSTCLSSFGFGSLSIFHLSKANSRLFFGLDSASFHSASVLVERVSNADDELFERVSSPIGCVKLSLVAFAFSLQLLLLFVCLVGFAMAQQIGQLFVCRGVFLQVVSETLIVVVDLLSQLRDAGVIRLRWLMLLAVVVVFGCCCCCWNCVDHLLLAILNKLSNLITSLSRMTKQSLGIANQSFGRSFTWLAWPVCCLLFICWTWTW